MACDITVEIHSQERLAVIPDLSYTSLDGSAVAYSDWEASIDGVEWVPARDSGHNTPKWNVADANYPGPGDDSDPSLTDLTVTAGRSHMKMRIIDDSVTEIVEIEIVRLP